MVTTTDEMRAWVGCLGCYNDGRLVGKWVPGTEAEEVTVQQLHAQEKVPTDIYTASHEELWVFDHEGYGSGVGEMSPMEATRRATYFERAEESGHDVEAVKAWLANDPGSYGQDWDDDEDSFEESFAGEWSSTAEFAEEFSYEIGSITDDSPLATYIDWDRVWTGDFDCDGWWDAPSAQGVYIFRPY